MYKNILPFNFNRNTFNLQQINEYFAAVVKLADALDSKSSGLIPRAGSTPASGTNKKRIGFAYPFFVACLYGRRRIRRKIACNFPVRVNGGHPPFIGRLERSDSGQRHHKKKKTDCFRLVLFSLLP